MESVTGRTLALEEFESGDDAEELLAEVVPPENDVVVPVVDLECLLDASPSTSLNDPLEDLEEVAEEVDVDEVGEPCESLERGWEERRAVVELDDAEVEGEEEFERLRHVPLALFSVDFSLGLAHLLLDAGAFLAHGARLLAAGLGHGLLRLASLATLAVLLLVPPNDALASLLLAEDGVGRRSDSTAAELVLESKVEERR